MKILIFHQGMFKFFNSKIQQLLSQKTFPENRTGDIIKYIEDNTSVCKDTNNIKDFCKNNPNNFIHVQGDYYVSWDEIYKTTALFKIQDVDITRPWTIQEYDGSEYIQYLDYNIVNTDMNYCVYKD